MFQRNRRSKGHPRILNESHVLRKVPTSSWDSSHILPLQGRVGVGRQCSFAFWNFHPLIVYFIPDSGRCPLQVRIFQCSKHPLGTSSVRRSLVLRDAPYYYLGDLEITAKPGQELRPEELGQDKAGNGETHPGLRTYLVDPIAIDEQNHIALCCWGIMAIALLVQLRGLLGTALCWLYAHGSPFGISVLSFQSRGLSGLHFRRGSSCQ